MRLCFRGRYADTDPDNVPNIRRSSIFLSGLLSDLVKYLAATFFKRSLVHKHKLETKYQREIRSKYKSGQKVHREQRRTLSFGGLPDFWDTAFLTVCSVVAIEAGSSEK